MQLRLRETRREASDVVSFIFEPDESLKWQAGQYLKYTLRHPDSDDRGEERYFSISSAPHEGFVMLTTRFAKRSSSFKRALRAMKPGDTIDAEELDGDFVVDDANRDHIFVAGGVGITPFRSILLDLHRRRLPIRATLLYANSNTEFPFQAELESLRKTHPAFQLRYVITPQRVDESMIGNLVKRLSDPVLYVSGPEPMVEAFDAMLKDMGIPEDKVKNDFFPGYDWPGDARTEAAPERFENAHER